MAKPNFKFQKRQKELDRKKKNDEKLQRKAAKKEPLPGEPAEDADVDKETDAGEAAAEEEAVPA
jgi:hypothetical protein